MKSKPKKYSLPIGRKVHVFWTDKTAVGHKYTLLAVEQGLALLRGRSEGGAEYAGPDGWVPISTMAWMEVDE